MQFITEKLLINEEFNSYRCKNLKVYFDIKYNDENVISFKIPETYSESDFQIYIQDLYLNDLPGNSFSTKEILKNNNSNLFDTNFEYDTYEKSDDEPKNFIDWKDDYDDHITNDDKFAYVKLENLQYIMHFDTFDLNCESEEDIEDSLKTIFESMNIENDDKIPFDLILNNDKMSYE